MQQKEFTAYVGIHLRKENIYGVLLICRGNFKLLFREKSKPHDHVLNEDRIATSNAMDDFLTGAGFSSACSENCSESRETDTDKVIIIDAILPKKFVVI